MDQHGYVVLVYTLASVVVAGFASFALVYTYKSRSKVNRNQEEFITAHRQVGLARIAWSCFAGSLGAYVISFFPSYSPYTGWIGLVMSATGQGIVMLIIAYGGEAIRKKVPHVLSLNDFVGWRYGWVAKTFVMILCLINMAVMVLSEYTVMGSLFSVYLGSVSYPMTITVGIATMLYTAYGGLIVSIVTDQLQGIAVVLLTVITAIYVAATFRHPLIGDPFPPGDCCTTPTCLEENPMGFCIAGTNKLGYGTIYSMLAANTAFAVFSEAFWQRAWASRDRKSLVGGCWLAFISISLVCFFTGVCGLLAAWAGLITPDININLYIFPAIKGSMNPETGTVNNWIGVLIILLALVMNMSMIDSCQNGMIAGISSHLLKGKPLVWTRLLVFIINVPLMILGARADALNLSIVEVYVLSNMLGLTTAIPLLMGVSGRLYNLLGGISMMFSSFLSILLTSVYGVDYYFKNFDSIRLTSAFGCDCIALSSPDALVGMSEADATAAQECIANICPEAKLQSRDIADGLRFTWSLNNFQWDIMLVPVCVSLGAMLLCAAFNWAYQRLGRAQCAVPGFTAPATHPDKYPLVEASEGSVDNKPADLPIAKEESSDSLPGASTAPQAQAPVVA